MKKLFDTQTLTLNFSTGYLKNYSHIKIGGKVNYIFEAKSVSDLLAVYAFARYNKLKIIPVGGGSNILFGNPKDSIIVPDKALQKDIKLEGELVLVTANYNINELIMKLSEFNLGGLEFLAGIPAHLGGLIAMNAGAFSHTISEFIEKIFIITPSGEQSTLSRNSISFDYRKTSIEGFIYKVLLKIKKVEKSQILKDVRHFIDIRKEKQPLTLPNLGSFYKNPPNNHTGKLIDELGLKGLQIGGAKISTKHANFIVNMKDATFDDITNLMKIIEEKVKKHFGLSLEREIRIIS